MKAKPFGAKGDKAKPAKVKPMQSPKPGKGKPASNFNRFPADKKPGGNPPY